MFSHKCMYTFYLSDTCSLYSKQISQRCNFRRKFLDKGRHVNEGTVTPDRALNHKWYEPARWNQLGYLPKRPTDEHTRDQLCFTWENNK
ncbi:hypothetical protein ANTRET_LOCUS6778 [Anthophora retusa]